MIYKCEICSYKDSRKANYTVHLKSQKHINNCLTKNINEDNNTITSEEHYKQLLTEKDKLLHEKDLILHEKDKQIKLLEDKVNIVDISTKNTNTKKASSSMSIINYVINNYHNAPHITTYNNFEKDKSEINSKEQNKSNEYA